MKVDIVAFDQRVHWKFVEAEAMNAADKWPQTLRKEAGLKFRLVDIVRSASEGVVAVMPEDHDLFVGFVMKAGPQHIAYAYTKYGCRRFGIASRLAAALGINLTWPTALSIWTPAASRIAAAGKYRLYPAIPREHQRT